jgi:Ca2+-binding EF-hand superfamily protein
MTFHCWRRAVAFTCVLLGAQLSFPAQGASSHPPTSASSCVTCHAGIEEMHPDASLTCTDCHGGDASARTKADAHVRAPATRVEDERILPLDSDLAWIQFRNPMDLRVAERTCGGCHPSAYENLRSSLHGTTAGHLSDGYYEMGLSSTRGSRYSVFPISGAPLEGGAVEQLVSPPAFQERLPRDEIATHYTDLARKECMQCHLWSQGRAVRGRVGFDGDYRGAGCSACHVTYALDGLSASADQAAVRTEPGHPLRHEMTRTPSTQTCTSCHYGDASIGLHFRGLSQLPPNAPGGPEVAGTTRTQLNRAFYLNDPSLVPPDVHHERGMHCIDCHTLGDVMGDGRLHGQMEYAVEISCSACHGTFDEVSTLHTERGTPLAHLTWDGERVLLRSKVDGREHVVPQVVHVLDPLRPEYDAEAARAMTPAHAEVECYTCHAGWNANFLGFHFSRHEQLTQLDLLSGRRTPGRVTTQEKVFATWKSFYVGRNERGAFAPYLTGFSTMGSVWDADGRLLLDQVMPVTAEGLSGLSMIHHQPHSTRPSARSCVECHRAPATWGLGSANFRLGRQLAFVADERGVEVVALERGDLARSTALAKLPLPDVVDLVVHADRLQGHAHHVYAAEGGRGVHVLDVRDPTAPRRVGFVATVDPLGLELAGEQLYVADGVGGLRILDVTTPETPRLLGHLPTLDAHDVDVRWPWAYVADGVGGLCIVDVRAPIVPRFLAEVDLNAESRLPNEAILVESLFQYSRPIARDGRPTDQRTRARNLCAVLDRKRGLHLVDVTEPELPELLYPRPDERTRIGGEFDPAYRGLALLSQVDLAEPQGGERTNERDYAYFLAERGRGDQRRSHLVVLDVSDPANVSLRERARVDSGYSTEQLVVVDLYDVPTRRRLGLAPGSRGVYLSDLSTSREPTQAGKLPGVGAYAVAVEEFPLDRMVDESGRPEKDVSHEGSRWLWRAEIERILSVDAAHLGTDGRARARALSENARRHLSEHDEDRSGALEGDELPRAGGQSMDSDGDGRVTLGELVAPGARAGEATSSERAPVPLDAARTMPNGDLARLLDGVDPFRFDADKKKGLSRSEAERAVFAALDLDGDEKLSRDELSRYPGELRALRFPDARAKELFAHVDRNRDGQVAPREFELADAEWEALDADRDGSVRLLEPAHAFQRARGFVPAGSEWPSRRPDLFLLPPGVAAGTLLQTFDRDGDEQLDARELERRPDLLALDANGDRRVARAEVAALLARIEDEGFARLPDDFVGRWDLDGSGAVEADELPDSVNARLARR